MGQAEGLHPGVGIVARSGLGRWQVANGFEQATDVEPRDSLESGELRRLEAPPWPAPARDAWLKAGRVGLLCCNIPEEYGGMGGDFLHSAIVLEELAAAGITGPAFSLHSDIVAPYLLHYGTEAQKTCWLPRMATGEVLGAAAMTEPSAGSDLQAIRTTALRDGDD